MEQPGIFAIDKALLFAGGNVPRELAPFLSHIQYSQIYKEVQACSVTANNRTCCLEASCLCIGLYMIHVHRFIANFFFDRMMPSRVNALNASLFDSKPVLSIRGKGRRLQFVFNTNLLVVNPDLVPPVPAKVDAPDNPVMAMAKNIDGSPSAPPAAGPDYPQGGVQMGAMMSAGPPPAMVNPYTGVYGMPPAVPGGYPGVGPYVAYPTADGRTVLYPAGGVAPITPGPAPVYVDAMGNPITYPVGGGYLAPQVYTGPQVFVGGGAPQVFVPGAGPTIYTPGM